MVAYNQSLVVQAAERLGYTALDLVEAVPQLRDSLPSYVTTGTRVTDGEIAAGQVRITTRDQAVDEACARWLEKVQLDEQRRMQPRDGSSAYYDETSIVRAAEELGYTALDLVNAIPQLRKSLVRADLTDAELATGAVLITTVDRAVDAACQRWLTKMQQRSELISGTDGDDVDSDGSALDGGGSGQDRDGSATFVAADALYAEHVHLAALFLAQSSGLSMGDAHQASLVARAQVHATIAQAAATRLLCLTFPPAASVDEAGGPATR